VGFTPTEERAAASDAVELLMLYSNHADQVKRISRLVDLPQRSGEPARTVPEIRRRPTAVECAALVAGYESGRTVREPADQIGFHRETVSAALKRAGVGRRYHQRRTVDLDRADELHAAGLSIADIAKVLGIGRTTLVKARRGTRLVPTRSSGTSD